MMMCPDCDRVYDETESFGCPYCSGELSDDIAVERIFKNCPFCDGIMDWYGEWQCSNCGETLDPDEYGIEDSDGVYE